MRAAKARLAKSVRVLPKGTLTPVTSFEEAAGRADEIHRWVLEGDLDNKTGDVGVKALREFRFAHGQADLARRVRELEKLVKAYQTKTETR